MIVLCVICLVNFIRLSQLARSATILEQTFVVCIWQVFSFVLFIYTLSNIFRWIESCFSLFLPIVWWRRISTRCRSTDLWHAARKRLCITCSIRCLIATSNVLWVVLSFLFFIIAEVDGYLLRVCNVVNAPIIFWLHWFRLHYCSMQGLWSTIWHWSSTWYSGLLKVHLSCLIWIYNKF